MDRDETLVTFEGRLQGDLLQRVGEILERYGAELLDVEQVAVRDRALLGLLVRLPAEKGCRAALEEEARSRGLSLSVEKAPAPGGEKQRLVATVFGPSAQAGALASVGREVAAHGGEVRQITRLARRPITAWELHLALPRDRDEAALRRSLLALAMDAPFDVALQREDVFRRAKRLVVFDMDSTLIRIEVIDELARAHGVVDQVAQITERAMQGEMDYTESLRQRVALLQGLDAAVLERIASNLPLTEGAERLVPALRRLGCKVAVLSGGFSVAASALRDRLGLDEAHSNELEIREGRLTGQVVGPIVDAQRKADLLESIAAREGIALEQTVAVGDGANDLLMLQKAGLGIAFRARQRLREAADLSIAASGLDAILFLLGLGEEEVAALG